MSCRYQKVGLEDPDSTWENTIAPETGTLTSACYKAIVNNLSHKDIGENLPTALAENTLLVADQQLRECPLEVKAKNPLKVSIRLPDSDLIEQATLTGFINRVPEQDNYEVNPTSDPEVWDNYTSWVNKAMSCAQLEEGAISRVPTEIIPAEVIRLPAYDDLVDLDRPDGVETFLVDGIIEHRDPTENYKYLHRRTDLYELLYYHVGIEPWYELGHRHPKRITLEGATEAIKSYIAKDIEQHSHIGIDRRPYIFLGDLRRILKMDAMHYAIDSTSIKRRLEYYFVPPTEEFVRKLNSLCYVSDIVRYHLQRVEEKLIFKAHNDKTPKRDQPRCFDTLASKSLNL